MLVDKYIIIHGDARECIEKLPKYIRGIIITDPPYPELEKHRAIGTTTRLVRKWFKVLSWDDIGDIFKHLIDRFVEAHIYVWANTSAIFSAKSVLDNYADFRNILVWHKKRLGMGYHYRNILEFILFYERGKRKLRDLSMSNFFMESVPKSLIEKHPTAKPVGVQAKLIYNSAKKSDFIIDPFMGIGTSLLATIKAEKSLGFDLRYIGIEIEAEYVEIAVDLAKKHGIIPKVIEG